MIGYAYMYIKTFLVGGFNPFEKYARQNWESSPNRGENKTYLKPSPSISSNKGPPSFRSPTEMDVKIFDGNS